MNLIIPLYSTVECTNASVADHVYWTYVNHIVDFALNPSQHGCPIPCRQTSYKIKMKLYQENNAYMPPQIPLSKGHFTFYPYWSTLATEEKVENLEYDLTNLLVSAGGNLGLFLGFSCLSILFTIIELLVAKCFKYRSNNPVIPCVN